jgi:hypothetical protein
VQPLDPGNGVLAGLTCPPDFTPKAIACGLGIRQLGFGELLPSLVELGLKALRCSNPRGRAFADG